MDKIQILNKLQEYKNFEKRADFAKFLGITPQTMNHWFTRGSYDIEIMAIKFPEISPKWLILGEGEMLAPMLKNAENTTESAPEVSSIVIDNTLIKDFVQQISELSHKNGELESENKRLQAEVERLRAENEALKTVHLDTDKNTDGEPPAAAV